MKTVYSSQELEAACRGIAAADWVCIDTEADSLHHYTEKLCLVQVGIPDEDYIFDPLASLDLRPLVEILSQKPLTLHGADFDIRILNRFYGFVPKEVFDTLLAAQLLGYEKQGLADLAFKHCGVVLPKSHQKADWSIRPLAQELLTYAANDTHYLKAIRTHLEEGLESLGRTDWHRESCKRLIKLTTSIKEEPDDDRPAWQIKGSKQLNPKALPILKSLWFWREEEAKRRDRPCFKVLHSEDMVQLARWAFENPGVDVGTMPKANRSIRGEHRGVLNRLISESKDCPPLQYVSAKKHSKPSKRWTKKEEDFFLAMKSERQKLAEDLKIHPSLLGTNASLEILALHPPKNNQDWEKIDVLMSWQKGLLAERFEKIWYNPTHETP